MLKVNTILKHCTYMHTIHVVMKLKQVEQVGVVNDTIHVVMKLKKVETGGSCQRYLKTLYLYACMLLEVETGGS